MAKQRRRITRYLRETKADAEPTGQAEESSGRIPANLTEQAPNNSYDTLLFYIDESSKG
jgi:hypothetical protein